MNRTRRAYKVTCGNPGSQPVLASAAALASGALLFGRHQAEFGKGGWMGDGWPWRLFS